MSQTRNPFTYIRPEAKRQIEITVVPGIDYHRPGSAANAGQNAASGQWKMYGQLDNTPLDEGDGFIVSDITGL